MHKNGVTVDQLVQELSRKGIKATKAARVVGHYPKANEFGGSFDSAFEALEYFINNNPSHNLATLVLTVEECQNTSES